MATQTYVKLQKQIADLEAQAAKLKSEETAGVVARIKEAITAYGLTQHDLFGSKSNVAQRGPKARKALLAKYVDGKGGQWVGRGKRPKWLSDALAAGKQLEDFLAEKFKSAVEKFEAAPIDKAGSSKAAKKSKKAIRRTAAKKRPSSVKYKDGAGNAWTGMGPTPRWLKEAVAGGKSREDFFVKG